MQTAKKTRVKFVIASVLLAAVLLIIFVFQDMNISNALYNPKSMFGILFESFGFWPAYLSIPLLGAALLWQPGPEIRHVMGLVLLLAGYSGIWYKTFDELVENGTVEKFSFLLPVILGIVCAVITALIMMRLHRATISRITFVCEVGVIYLLFYNAVGVALKLLWGRWRYFEMAEIGNFDHYSPWYLPQGVTGHSSFPSGHVMAACGIFLLLIYVYVANGSKTKKCLVAMGCTAYVLCMAVSRVVMGRHFASDTIVAMLISSAVFGVIVITSRYHKWYYYYKAKQSREGLKFTG